VIHEVYLPFTQEQLLQHFTKTGKGDEANAGPLQHLQYYLRSVDNYANSADSEARKGKSIKELKRPCQIEKDEKFWTASCLMGIYHSPDRSKQLSMLLQKAYGPTPPISGISSWDDGVSGNLHLFFEPNLPSPKSYKNWLGLNLHKRQFIPYICDSAEKKPNLEGPTNVDALLINEDNGFAVLIEAKVLSDISCQVTYDVMRNQIARNIDVMLESRDLGFPLSKRRPEKSLLLLLTPRIFQENRSSRLYGYKFNEYKNDPESLGRDLPNRRGYDWESLSRRLGWLTWEDFREVNPDCCRWLE
jgi:hypothetical protein